MYPAPRKCLREFNHINLPTLLQQLILPQPQHGRLFCLTVPIAHEQVIKNRFLTLGLSAFGDLSLYMGNFIADHLTFR